MLRKSYHRDIDVETTLQVHGVCFTTVNKHTHCEYVIIQGKRVGERKAGPFLFRSTNVPRVNEPL